MSLIEATRPNEAARRELVTRGILLAAVAIEFGVDVEDIKGRSRRAAFARPRSAYVLVAQSRLSASKRAIGRMLGDRDHSTIWTISRNAARLRQYDRSFAERVASIELWPFDMTERPKLTRYADPCRVQSRLRQRGKWRLSSRPGWNRTFSNETNARAFVGNNRKPGCEYRIVDLSGRVIATWI